MHHAGARGAHEVDIARAIQNCGDHGGAADDMVIWEVFRDFIDVAHPVHRREGILMRFKQWGAALQDLGQLHLLDENDPHVRIAGVVFWEGNIDCRLLYILSSYVLPFVYWLSLEIMRKTRSKSFLLKDTFARYHLRLLLNSRLVATAQYARN